MGKIPKGENQDRGLVSKKIRAAPIIKRGRLGGFWWGKEVEHFFSSHAKKKYKKEEKKRSWKNFAFDRSKSIGQI